MGLIDTVLQAGLENACRRITWRRFVVLELRHYVETRGNFTVHKLFRRKRATGTCLSSHIVSSPVTCGRPRQITFGQFMRAMTKSFAEAIVLFRVTITHIELASNFSDKMRISCRYMY